VAYITTSDGVDIFYQIQGDDSSEHTLVFLNGMTQSTVHWKSHVRALSDDYQVVTYDARGQGKSDHDSEDFTLRRHTRDLKDILDANDMDTVTLVGFSHGGRIAAGFIDIFEERVHGLVLCGASYRDSVRSRLIVRSWRETLKRGDMTALAWTSLPVIIGEDYLHSNEQMLEGIIRATVERNSQEGVWKLLDALPDYPDMSGLVDGVSVEALVMAGENDMLVEWKDVQNLGKALDAKIVKVPGVGHTVPIEAPETFRRHLRGFLE
jgi:3-oxoadipate enol-lactonase